jgi:glycosyltransferase involved in cell wall biosynthesis
MSGAGTRRPKIAFITSRELDGESMAGRLHVAHAIRRALSGWADLEFHRLPSVLTDFSLERALGAGWAGLRHLMGGAVLPLQCALFASPPDLKALVDRLPADLDAVYIDGVRGYALLEALRRRRPDLRIVVDLDDLMSRRMDLLFKAEQPLSPGYLTKRLPAPLLRLIMSRPAGRLIVRYERATLRSVERAICDLADATVLLSSTDAEALTAYAGGRRAEIIVIPPAREPAAHPRPFTAPRRFVFVGSDALTQNRLTIDYLVEFWGRYAIPTPLVLFGLSYRSIALPPGVSAQGYVERIEDIYDGSSVLITPSRIGGGIKTKVLEAFAYGAPVIGNALTFESMPIDGYPLMLDDEAVLRAAVSDPRGHGDAFRQAARIGADYLARHHAEAEFGRRWRALMVPGAAP